MSEFVFNPMRDAPDDTADGPRPRDLVDRPEMFGRWGKPMRAAAGVDPTDARFIAANLQHWVANAVREEVLMLRTNLATLLPTLATTSPELTLDRLSRLQHGDEPMRLDDLLILSRRFDSVRDILVSAFGDATRPPVATKPPQEGGMGPVLTTRRGREAR
ncbi:hypothetical protein ET475_08485 [Microbacterium protaetiae]|uniref:Uncharacterized protein n=1 Tax=Microbacterium protaetiae TaxID=2509458 RepID=A0A4P6EF53_9MICO|nr:hypothetical protein [Microbacterium protaetiae]QAY60023.1 hypothetical protein ET475_08485 [Microbacterium protaetiae]